MPQKRGGTGWNCIYPTGLKVAQERPIFKVSSPGSYALSWIYRQSYSNFNWIAGRWNGTINYGYTTWRGFRLRKKSKGCLQLNELDRMLERPSVAGISTSFLDGRTSRMNDRGSDKSGIQKLESISRSDAYPLPTPYQSFFIGPARTITRLSTRTELR